MSQQAEAEGMESFSEANDFDVDDPEFSENAILSGYEVNEMENESEILKNVEVPKNNDSGEADPQNAEPDSGSDPAEPATE
jgi:hypothetical protein